MKRTTLAKKIEMIKEGKAYVSKCDGAYFFYIGNDYVRISKAVYDELSYITTKEC